MSAAQKNSEFALEERKRRNSKVEPFIRPTSFENNALSAIRARSATAAGSAHFYTARASPCQCRLADAAELIGD